jgi:hypothetical protein
LFNCFRLCFNSVINLYILCLIYLICIESAGRELAILLGLKTPGLFCLRLLDWIITDTKRKSPIRWMTKEIKIDWKLLIRGPDRGSNCSYKVNRGRLPVIVALAAVNFASCRLNNSLTLILKLAHCMGGLERTDGPHKRSSLEAS